MKTRKNKNTVLPPRAAGTMTRTVKIADGIHHRIRVLSVQKRMPMQNFIENLLLAGLRDKVYEKFVEDETRTAAAA